MEEITMTLAIKINVAEIRGRETTHGLYDDSSKVKAACGQEYRVTRHRTLLSEVIPCFFYLRSENVLEWLQFPRVVLTQSLPCYRIYYVTK